MAIRYAPQKIFIAAIYVALVTLSLFVVVASTISKSGIIPGYPIINSLSYYIALIPALAFVFGILHALSARSTKTLFSWIVSLLVCTPALSLFYASAIECDISNHIKRRLPSKLTNDEISSLRTTEIICPTFYSYRIGGDGKPAVVTGAADFIHGTKVWFGAQ